MRTLILLSFGYDPLQYPKCNHQMVFLDLYQKHERVPLEELYERAMAPYLQFSIIKKRSHY